MTASEKTKSDVMAANLAAYEEELVQIRRRYLDSLPLKINALEKALQGLSDSDQPTRELEDLNRIAHQLAASAGSHGLNHISDAARRLDDASEEIDLSEDDAAEAVREMSDALIDMLRHPQQ